MGFDSPCPVVIHKDGINASTKQSLNSRSFVDAFDAVNLAITSSGNDLVRLTKKRHHP